MKSVKINITLRDDLLERADLYASNNAVTRSGLISLALSQYLDAMQKKPVVADAIGQMGVLLKLAVTGKTDSAEYDAALKALEASQEALNKKAPTGRQPRRRKIITQGDYNTCL